MGLDRDREPVRSRARFLIALGASAFALSLAPASCIYPSFTFKEAEPTGGSGGAGGSGGGSTAQENCQNQQDDDGDGDVDCADADCGGAGFACVPGVPLGWTGYQALYAGPESGAPASCPSAFPSTIPYKGMADPMVPQASCEACGCSAPTGEACDLPDVITVIETTCAQAGNAAFPQNLQVPANWDGSCDATDGAPGGQSCGGQFCNRSVKADAPTLLSGTCVPTGGAPNIPPVDWAVHGTACGDAPLGGGCDAGQSCQPAPPTPFLPGLCISKGGDQECPGMPFTDKHVLFEDADDTRACSACSCGNSAGGSCSANITVYTDAACSTGPITFAAGGCAGLSGNPPIAGRKAQLMPISPGSCPPSGGEVSGEVTPKQPTTFCCIP